VSPRDAVEEGKGSRPARAGQAVRGIWAFTLGYVNEREEFYGKVLGHVVMHDPEGNEFCIA
jgi:hypothetical protein